VSPLLTFPSVADSKSHQSLAAITLAHSFRCSVFLPLIKIAVCEYTLTDPLEKGFQEVTTHLVIYHVNALGGQKQLYRSVLAVVILTVTRWRSSVSSSGNDTDFTTLCCFQSANGAFDSFLARLLSLAFQVWLTRTGTTSRVCLCVRISTGYCNPPFPCCVR
jgi:hypothetical protein